MIPGFDPIYWLFLAPGILLSMWAQYRVKSAFHHASQYRTAMTGADAAAALMRESGLRGVKIERAQGFLSDHYSPGEKVLRLSPPVHDERNLAAFGVAAHEVGHAFQDAQNYTPLVVRNAIVPLAGLGGNLSWIVLIAGFMLQMAGLIYVGIGLFSLTVVFQLINLPVEFDASARARKHLLETGMVSKEEDAEVARVLNAAAMTYVAATLTSVMTLLYFLYRAGVFNRR